MRWALVTGGAQGIGAAVVRRLAEQGLTVTVGDLEEKHAAAEEQGFRFTALDVTDEESVARAVERAGPVDVLVNCAGVTVPGRPTDEITLAEWEWTLAVNLTGTFLCTRAVVPGMRERRYGRVVNLASGLATRGVAGTAAYAASKAGVVGLTRAVAADLAPHGVTVNAVAPGYVDTPMTQGFPAELRERRLAEIGMGRFARPEEIAAVVGFLCSEEASYVTGALVQATGGFRI
ncbi:MAG TPA: SDR family NAD(P)-dependent oxidoreductase [Gaiellaceae bacterium]|jgi:3-oxoacyl-[acyl-carrier protein] reductase|nr:SDR family NAD(P)-dependent oxidoreductase [Gaiellaceae bacterium]